jgi:hypothetical protein
VALTKNDAKIIEEIFGRRFAENDAAWDKRLEKRFAQQDAAWDERLEKRFAQQDAAWDKRLDERFAQQDTAWDERLEKRFAQQDAAWDKRLDVQFAQQDAVWDKRLEERFAQQDAAWDKKLKGQFAQQDTAWYKRLTDRLGTFRAELLADLMQVFPTKDEMHQCVEEAKKELKDEFRTRMTSVQDSVVGFRKELDFGIPPMVGLELQKTRKVFGSMHSRILALEKKT